MTVAAREATSDMAVMERIDAVKSLKFDTPREKAAAIARARADEAERACGDAKFPQSFAFGQTVVTIERWNRLNDHAVEIWAGATVDGIAVAADLHHVIVNPPVRYISDDGDQVETVALRDGKTFERRWRADPLACLASAVAETFAAKPR